ncbi:MAG: PaaI family thioesterase [Anaerolineae bacterium]
MQEIIDNFNRQTAMVTIGAELTHVAAGEVDIELPFRQDLCQQAGFIHAGMITTVIDTACGFAAQTLMPANSDVVTVEFKINFMSPAVGDRFIGRGRVVKSGKTLTITQGDVYAIREQEGTEKHIATMQATMFRVATNS